MTPGLAQLQEGFMEALLDGAPLRHAVTPPRALDIHRRNQEANLRGALAAAFPVTCRLVGDAFFAESARAFGARSPSTSGDLHRFGDRFPAFLRGYAPAAGLAYLPDVALLEWAVHESFHAADTPPFDFAGLAGVPAHAQGALRVRLAAAVRLVSSAHPVLAIWEANQPGRDGTPDRAQGPDRVLVRRSGAEVTVERLDDDAWHFIAALARGVSLEEAAGALGAGEARLPAILAGWTADGVIAAFDRPA